MPRNRRLGANYEDAATDHLRSLGYTIVTRNYYAKVAELDIVALDGDVLVFVEVRQRSKGGWELPEESVSAAKQKRLWTAAELYVCETLGREAPMRFDVVAFDGDMIRHHIDAFRPSPR